MVAVARELHPNQGSLEDEPTRSRLLDALATEGATYALLGRRYGVSYQAVQAFHRRHEAEVLALALRRPGWAADKRAVLQECTHLIDEIEHLAHAVPDPSVDGLAAVVGPSLHRLQSAAEALGRYDVRRPRQACA